MFDKLLQTLKAKGVAETDKKTDKKTNKKIISIMRTTWNIRKLKEADLVRRVGRHSGPLAVLSHLGCAGIIRNLI